MFIDIIIGVVCFAGGMVAEYFIMKNNPQLKPAVDVAASKIEAMVDKK